MIQPGNLARDLVARPGVENEWWYYHGHLSGGLREFGFHLVFFRRWTDRLRVGRVLPVRRVSKNIHFAHFALVDVGGRQLRYGHRRALLGDAGASAERYEVWVGDWRAQEVDGAHWLKVGIRGVDFDVRLRPGKTAVRWGGEGDFRRADSGRTTYLFCPHLEASGRVQVDGVTFPVTGKVWMDRDFGEFRLGEDLHGWDWFAMQFADGRELMVYRLRDRRGRQTRHSGAVLVGADGSPERLGHDEFDLAPLGGWRSRHTGIYYPLRWRLRSSRIDADLLTEPLLRCCEIDTRGSTNVIYWEGPQSVQGRLLGRECSGRCYAELVGYAGQEIRLDQYDFTSDNLPFLGFVANEVRLRLYGPGVRVSEPQTAAEPPAPGDRQPVVDGRTRC